MNVPQPIDYLRITSSIYPHCEYTVRMRPPRWRGIRDLAGLTTSFSHRPRAISSRLFSSIFAHHQSQFQPQSQSKEPVSAELSPRWLSDLKSRIGRCIQFGCSPGQVQEAGMILQELTRDWRALVAGSEGFLTSEDRMELCRHDVVWGEMVSSYFFDLEFGGQGRWRVQ